MKNETLAEAHDRIQRLHDEYHATIGMGSDRSSNPVGLVNAFGRLERQYKACYSTYTARLTKELAHESRINAFIDVSPSLHRVLPASLVPIGELKQSKLARELSNLCRQTFKPSLLSELWLNGRHFIDSDFRYHVEYVCGFEDLHRVVAEQRNQETVVVDLQTMAIGLKELLECFEPRCVYGHNAIGLKVATTIRDRLIRTVTRFLKKIQALGNHIPLKDFRPTQAELAKF